MQANDQITTSHIDVSNNRNHELPINTLFIIKIRNWVFKILLYSSIQIHYGADHYLSANGLGNVWQIHHFFGPAPPPPTHEVNHCNVVMPTPPPIPNYFLNVIKRKTNQKIWQSDNNEKIETSVLKFRKHMAFMVKVSSVHWSQVTFANISFPCVTGKEKAHGPTETRTQDLSRTVRALWPLSYPATRPTCDSFPLLN